LDEALVKRLNDHVFELAHRIGERNWNRHGRLNEARDYVAHALRSYGYDVRFESYDVLGKTCYNVIAEKPGRGRRAREIVLVGGHYDSAGGTPGADDNASGVAMLLETARAMKNRDTRRALRFVAFSTEEAFLFQKLSMEERLKTMGSFHHARDARRRNEKITAMLSLEMLGFYSDDAGSQKTPKALRWLFPTRGNFALVVGDFSSAGTVLKTRRALAQGAGVPVSSACLPRFVKGVQNSDHRHFWAHGYPAAMVTDTAFYRNNHYHRPSDRHETLDYRRMALLLPGLADSVAALAR